MTHSFPWISMPQVRTPFALLLLPPNCLIQHSALRRLGFTRGLPWAMALASLFTLAATAALDLRHRLAFLQSALAADTPRPAVGSSKG